MEPQVYNWTCSVASFAWVINSTGTANISREEALELIGYPDCVNETYGCMSAECLIAAYRHFDLSAKQEWVTFDQAYSIMSNTTGQINPIGMYHYMAIRGVDGHNIGTLWVANSAPGYRGVYDTLTRDKFNAFGPVQLIYLT